MRYGIIGNCKTAALVGEDANIGWLCLPKFDSPSVFAHLLDPRAGSFQVLPPLETKPEQRYLPKTNILETVFDDGKDAFSVVDFMPRYREGGHFAKPLEIHRLIRPLRGNPSVRIRFQPRLNYARGETAIRERTSFITASNDLESLFLYTTFPLRAVMEEHPIPLDRDHHLLLTYHEKISPPSLDYSRAQFDMTKKYWETWSGHCRLPPLRGEEVLRSALTLKLLTYEDTGAIVAAPTTSLPEVPGESRNWDYRYCWLRDASLMLEALKSLGHFEEAKAFIHFLLRLFESKQSRIQIVYGLGGRTDLDEKILSHLAGHKNSSPVRIGNNACHTQQNDIYGEMLNTIYLYFFHYELEKMPDDVWSLVKFLVNTAARSWQTQDAGIWEFRHRKLHFTFSKVLSWVALDRGIRMAKLLGKDYAASNWDPFASQIRADIEKEGWNESLGAFVQAYGFPHLDASLLLMERCGFLDKKDPRWVSTVRACEERLVVNDLAFRYVNADDYGPPPNALILASLWMAQALHSIGDEKRGHRMFEQVLSHANHLGLLSEHVNVHTGELTGNFPQAYSHMEVINTANVLAGNRGRRPRS